MLISKKKSNDHDKKSIGRKRIIELASEQHYTKLQNMCQEFLNRTFEYNIRLENNLKFEKLKR